MLWIEEEGDVDIVSQQESLGGLGGLGVAGMWKCWWYLAASWSQQHWDTGSYSQLFHLLHAHWHAAGLLGDKPAQWQGSVNTQQGKIKVLQQEDSKGETERGRGQRSLMLTPEQKSWLDESLESLQSRRETVQSCKKGGKS